MLSPFKSRASVSGDFQTVVRVWSGEQVLAPHLSLNSTSNLPLFYLSFPLWNLFLTSLLQGITREMYIYIYIKAQSVGQNKVKLSIFPQIIVKMTQRNPHTKCGGFSRSMFSLLSHLCLFSPYFFHLSLLFLTF